MQQAKEMLVNQWVKRQLDNELNEDVYEKRLTAQPPAEGFEKVPCCVYFYYVRVDRIGTVRADHYFYANGPEGSRSEEWREIPYEEMAKPDGLMKMLADNARPSGEHKFALPNNSFRDVVWNHRSYIAIFFDERNWFFHQRTNNKSSVVFNVTEGRDPNRTFFDAKDLVLEMRVRGRRGRPDTTDRRSAIFFVNHFKDNDGTALGSNGRAERKYKFDMYLQARYARPDAPPVTVIFDPDGTNQGPST